jgi:capsular polysaccharide biosynthesis protein
VDFWTAIGVLFHRWYLVLLGIALTFGSAAGLFSAIAPTYKATGLVLLIGPTGADGADSTSIQKNPYLGFGGSLNVMAQVTAKVMNSETVVRQVLGERTDVEYLVDLEPGDAPLVSVSVTGRAPEEVVQAQYLVQEALGHQLQELQAAARAPAETWIQVTIVARPEEASYQSTSRIRGAAGVIVLGGAGTLLMTFLVDGRSRRRRLRASTSDVDDQGADVHGDAFSSSTTITALPTTSTEASARPPTRSALRRQDR